MEAELVPVVDSYPVGEIRSITRIERGHVDENWLVETEQGHYFLKRRHPRRRQPECLIRAQHELIKHLRQTGFPAPRLVPTVSGETYLLLGEDLYELEAYIEGEPYDHSRPEHLDAAARMLGRYHVCVAGFAPQVLRERDRLYSPAGARRHLNRLRESWDLGQDAELAGIGRLLEVQVDDLQARFARHTRLPNLVIHGDYYAGNLLFVGDHIVGVVDYDKVSWQQRVAELAEALVYFASPRPGYLQHLVYPGVLEWGPFARFLQGYARVVALEQGEIHALPDIICCIWFSVSLRRLLERNARRPPQASEALREVLALVHWARAQDGRMVEVATAAMDRELP